MISSIAAYCSFAFFPASMISMPRCTPFADGASWASAGEAAGMRNAAMHSATFEIV